MSQALRVNQLLATFQRKRRLIAIQAGSSPDKAGPEANYVEEAVLQILSSGVKKNVGELAELVGLERSWMSRVITGMVDRNLIKAVPSAHDKRNKEISITDFGEKLLLSLHQFLKGVMDKTLDGVTQSEKNDLHKFLKQLCDGFKAQESIPYPEGDPIHLQLARLSRTIGVFGDSVLDTGFTMTQLQLLALLSNNVDQPVQASTLDSSLPFDVSTLSRTLASFEEDQLISRKRSPEDKRSILIQLTGKGLSKIKEILAHSTSKFASAMSKISKEDISKGIAVLEKISAELPQAVETKSGSRLTIFPARPTKSNIEESKTIFSLTSSKGELGKVTIRKDDNGNVAEIKLVGNYKDEESIREALEALSRGIVPMMFK